MVNRLAWESSAQRRRGDRLRDVIDCWFSSFDQLRFRLVDPSNHESEELSWSNPHVPWTSRPDFEATLDYERFHRDNGDSRLLVRVLGTRGPIPAGRWHLKITSASLQRPMKLHAWVDRIRDAMPVEFVNHTLDGTLSVPGTAKTVVGVGAAASAAPIEVPPFASHGGTRDGRQKPEVSAPSVNVNAAASHTGTGVLRMSGTSMAAPHVTGAVALLLSYAAKQGRKLDANQILKALPASTRDGNAGWHPGSGFGVVDIAALFQAFGFWPPTTPPSPASEPAHRDKSTVTTSG
jgi:endonuclease G